MLEVFPVERAHYTVVVRMGKAEGGMGVMRWNVEVTNSTAKQPAFLLSNAVLWRDPTEQRTLASDKMPGMVSVTEIVGEPWNDRRFSVKSHQSKSIDSADIRDCPTASFAVFGAVSVTM